MGKIGWLMRLKFSWRDNLFENGHIGVVSKFVTLLSGSAMAIVKSPHVVPGTLVGCRLVQKIGAVLLLDAILTAGCEFFCLFGKRGEEGCNLYVYICVMC